MKENELVGYCIACNHKIFSDALTNYNKSIYVCPYCSYPNDKSDLNYSLKK